VISTDPYIAMWVMDKAGRWLPDMTAIGDIRNGKIIAGVAFESQNPQCLWGHQRVDESPSREFWIFVAKHIFVDCGCKRFSAMVESDNEKAIKLNLHIGFEIEATLKQAGKSGDIHIMTLWKDNCRFLRWKRREAHHERKDDGQKISPAYAT
jgi:hypothetical protein